MKGMNRAFWVAILVASLMMQSSVLLAGHKTRTEILKGIREKHDKNQNLIGHLQNLQEPLRKRNLNALTTIARHLCKTCNEYDVIKALHNPLLHDETIVLKIDGQEVRLDFVNKKKDQPPEFLEGYAFEGDNLTLKDISHVPRITVGTNERTAEPLNYGDLKKKIETTSDQEAIARLLIALLPINLDKSIDNMLEYLDDISGEELTKSQERKKALDPYVGKTE